MLQSIKHGTNESVNNYIKLWSHGINNVLLKKIKL